MSDRIPTQCDQCGQTDDHPKAHGSATVPHLEQGRLVFDERGKVVFRSTTKHHDCLSADERQMLVDSTQRKGAPKASAVIDACVGGLRGDKLLEKILSGDLPKATGKEPSNG